MTQQQFRYAKIHAWSYYIYQQVPETIVGKNDKGQVQAYPCQH